jgi:carboxyl-terminal processing protease
MRRGFRIALLGVGGTAVLAATFFGGARYGAEQIRARDAWADGRLLSTAIDSVRANALDSLPSDELIRRAVAGMLRELHDPYAALLQPDGYKTYRGSLLGEGQGLGLSLRRQGATLNVRSVASGSPAATAGVRRGDRVLAWNGIPVTADRTRQPIDSAEQNKSTIQLTLWRAPFGDTAQLTLHRRTWHMPAVTESGMLSDSVGYARLATVSQHASDELERSVLTLTRRGAKALVLDLRGNGGGLFEEGVNVAGLFLPPDAVVASLSGRGGAEPQVYRAPKSRWPTLPITVLVDANTASSAELIAAALREHNRALLVGDRTYGKGVVQRVVRLSSELSLRLTTARWLTPGGHSLERRTGKGRDATGGLQPDIALDDASVREPFDVPRDWTTSVVSRLVAKSDSVAIRALREDWPMTPLALLESRLQQALAPFVPKDQVGTARGAQWLSTATRLATVRLLEADSQPNSLLQYSVRDDAALRAGLDVLAPGANVVRALSVDDVRTTTVR